MFSWPGLVEAQGLILPHCISDTPCPWIGSRVVRTSTVVRAELVQRVVKYEITETFKNLGGGLAEADYLFPLPAGAAFQDLQLSANGEMIAGETYAADEARHIYESIIRQRRDPALVEWMGFGLLRARIFPLAAGEEKRIVVRYQAVAPREGDAIRVDYHVGGAIALSPAMPRPIVMRMRVPGSDAAELPDDRWTFELRYLAGETYGPPYSPTHVLTVSRDGSWAVVTTSGASHDLTVLLPTMARDGGSVAVLPYAPGGRDGFALITVTPPAVRVQPTPRDVTLVIDVSGSMMGRKIEQARAAGRAVLATLTPRDRFRLIDFSTDVRTFRSEFVAATPDHIAQAQQYLDALEADGSTNISGALDTALQMGGINAAPTWREGTDGVDATPTGHVRRLRLVLFVTDGEPTIGERNPDSLVVHAMAHLDGAHLFTFGLGADVNASLLEQLAIQGHGTSQFVRPEESVERAVSLVAHQLTDPVVTDLRITTDGVRLLQALPQAPIDLFAGQDLVLLARYHGSGLTELHFAGRTASGEVSWTATAEFPEQDRANPFVARLWATQRIGYLTAERHRGGSSSEVDDEIKSLGEEYGIPTELTSYLVREPDQQVASAGLAPNALAFERAKVASAQREVTALAMADALAPSAAIGSAVATARGRISGSLAPSHVGDRTMVYRDSVWVDTRYTKGERVVTVALYSPAYFALLRDYPELRAPFALGDRVRVAGRHVAIETGNTGISAADDARLAVLRNDW